MGFYDQAARRATQREPLAVMTRLGEMARQRWRFVDWTQTQTTPKPGERDQTADRAAVLEDVDHVERVYLALLEFQSEHVGDKLDDLSPRRRSFAARCATGRSGRTSTSSCRY